MAPRSIMLRVHYALSFAALGVYLPYFPRWLEARGVLGLGMGAVAATLPAMSVVGPPTFGLLADVLGLRGSLLRIACTGTFLGFLALAALTWDGAPPALAALMGVSLAIALFRSPMIMLADVLALEHVAAAGTTYPRVRLWGSVGFLVAAVLAARFIDMTAPSALPVVVALLFGGAAASSFALPRRAASPDRPSAKGMRGVVASRDFQLFLATALLSQAAHSAYDLCFTLHLRDVGLREDLVGIAWAVGVVAEVGLMAFAAPLFARASPPALMVVALAGASARWAVIAWLDTPGWLLAAQPLHALSFGLMWVSCLAYTKGRVAPDVLATAQGLFLGAIGVGSVIGMLTWGSLYASHGGGLVFTLAAVIAGAAASLAIVFARAVRARGPQTGAPLPVPLAG